MQEGSLFRSVLTHCAFTTRTSWQHHITTTTSHSHDDIAYNHDDIAESRRHHITTTSHNHHDITFLSRLPLHSQRRPTIHAHIRAYVRLKRVSEIARVADGGVSEITRVADGGVSEIARVGEGGIFNNAEFLHSPGYSGCSLRGLFIQHSLYLSSLDWPLLVAIGDNKGKPRDDTCNAYWMKQTV